MVTVLTLMVGQLVGTAAGLAFYDWYREKQYYYYYRKSQ